MSADPGTPNPEPTDPNLGTPGTSREPSTDALSQCINQPEFYSTEQSCSGVQCPSQPCNGVCTLDAATPQCVSKTQIEGTCKAGSCVYLDAKGQDAIGGACNCNQMSEVECRCRATLADAKCFCKENIESVDHLCSVCGNGVTEPGEDCDNSGGNSDTVETAPCSATCKKKYFVCCKKDAPGGCITGDSIDPTHPSEQCIQPVVFVLTEPTPQACNVVKCPSPCLNDQTCGVAPGCKDGAFKGLYCESDDDCEGSECLRIEYACNKDIECTGCQNDKTIHQCAVCIQCTPDQREIQKRAQEARDASPCTRQETASNALQCCPEPTPKAGTPRPSEQMKRSPPQQYPTRPVRHEKDCESNASPQGCRLRLGCMCQHCTDSCDFDIDGKCVPIADQKLALDEAGIADEPLGSLDAFSSSLGGAVPAAARTTDQVISKELCQALNESSCHLHTSSPIYAVIELHDGSLTVKQTYQKEKFDIYRIHAAERTVLITIETIANEVNYGTQLVYLIASGHECCNPEVIWPDKRNALLLKKNSWEFLVPSVGDYLVVYSIYKWTQTPLLQTPVPSNAFDDVRCNDYKISVDYHAPVCPQKICELKPCIAPRDCDSSQHCNVFSCDQNIHRCILAEPNDDQHAMFKQGCRSTEQIDQFNALPSGKNLEPVKRKRTNNGGGDYDETPLHKEDATDVCAKAPNGAECVVRKYGKCSLGKCQSGACIEVTAPRVQFECDCKCPSQCKNVPDCEKKCKEEHKNDRQNTWTGFCLVCGGDGTCVCRKEEKPDGCCVDSSRGRCTTMSEDDSKDQCIGVDISFSPTACCSNSTCATKTVIPPCPSTTTTVVVTPTPTAPGGAATASATRQTIRLIGSMAAKAPLADSVAEINEPATIETVLQALDAGELRRMQLAIDIFGTESTAPVCGVDLETRVITVRAASHKQSAGGACDRVDISHKCLDGAAQMSESGHELVDRAARTLNQATRYAQAGQTLGALQQSCCALAYYAALSEWCSTSKDSLAALATMSVVRSVDGVGPTCVMFDDAHVDQDLNDFVAEQVVVEIRGANNRLLAVNVHVLPLARGGGYKSSYAISLRGASIQSVDNGVNAACSERARAIMHDTFDPASIAALLRQRKQFPEGTRINVLHHVEHSGDDSNALPPGVRESFCTVLGGALDEARCRRTDRGDVALFDDVRSALPPVQGDAIDRLLSQGIRIDQSTNTYHKSPTIRARYTSSATILLPRQSSGADASATLGADSVRFVLRNEDCGAAVILLTPSEQRATGDEPIALAIPPHSCAAARWTNEGQKLVNEFDDSSSRVCRGGVEGGIVQCTNEHDTQCTSAGGQCSQPPSVQGVPFRNAKRHFQCKTCYTDSDCANEPTCANHECCAEELLHWYRYPTSELVYAGHELNIAEAILKPSSTTTTTATEQQK